MTAAIIPFTRTAEEAWQAFQALNQDALADPRLLMDPDHMERREAAHALFAALFRRECERGDFAQVKLA